MNESSSLKEKEQINSAHTPLCWVGNPALQPELEGAYKTAEYEGISEGLFSPHNKVEEIKCVRNAQLIYQGEEQPLSQMHSLYLLLSVSHLRYTSCCL